MVDTNFFNFNKKKYLKRSNRSFIISYIGTIGMAHCIQTIIDAAKILSINNKDLKIEFQIIGDGADSEKIKTQALIMDNVKVFSAVSKEKVLEYLDKSDAGIIHLRKNNLFKTVVPSKMFEYMAMGIPILHGVDGESHEILKRHNLGIYFEGENPNELCSAILKLYNNKSLYNEISQNCVKTSKLFKREILALKMLEEIIKIEKNRKKN